MKIGELAHCAGLNASAIRYYEKIGLLSPPHRSGGQRRYPPLVNMASCANCHTTFDKGQDIPGMAFAGGFSLVGPWGSVAAANITPDPSGISYYDEALFLQMMRAGSVKARKLNPIMPTGIYRNLADEDLKAMFAYLRTLKPVRHRVDNSQPPTFCKLCRHKHGAGDQN